MIKRNKTLISAVVLAVSASLFFSACGKTGTSASTEISGSASTVSTSTSSASASVSKEEPVKEQSSLPNTFKVPMEDIYVDVPGFQEIEEGLTEVFRDNEIKYVAVTANWKAEAADLDEAHERCFEKFLDNMTNYKGGVNGITITSSESKTLNGIEMKRFVGTINYGTDTKMEGYAIGYSFIMNNIPCEIIGSVIDDGQSKQEIDEITKIVDEMASTVRNKE